MFNISVAPEKVELHLKAQCLPLAVTLSLA